MCPAVLNGAPPSTTTADMSADQLTPGGAGGASVLQPPVGGSPTEGPLLALMERTGYPMVQENGQRRYGPPPGWGDTPAPPRGCEVFVGKIPRDCFEDELVPIFEKCGKIYEIRLMMDFNGANRGYCFVMYTSRGDAKRAVRELNDYEIRHRRFLGVCLSVDNCRLFVGGIPRDKQGFEIMEEMKKVAEGVVNAIVYPSVADKSKNRGFAFVEFESHRAAAMARRKLLPGRVQLWGQPIAVDWAEPEQEVDEDVMSKVKILYVRNLMLTTTEETLDAQFNTAAGYEVKDGVKDGAALAPVERVKKLKDYAFIHFRERSAALQALQIMNGADIEGSKIEVVLAKPVERDNFTSGYPRTSAGKPVSEMTAPGVVYHGGGGLSATTLNHPFYATGTGGGTLYSQQIAQTNGSPLPTIITRGIAPAAIRDGGGQPHGTYQTRGRTAAGTRGAGGSSRGYSARSGGVTGGNAGGYRPQTHLEGTQLYDLHPGMELIPTNPHTLKPHRSPMLTLDELCQKNGWGLAQYHLHQAIGRDVNNTDMQLFVFKVLVPGLSPNAFMSNKLSRSVDEARRIAADNVLAQLFPQTTPLPQPARNNVHLEGVFPYATYPTTASATTALPAAYTYG